MVGIPNRRRADYHKQEVARWKSHGGIRTRRARGASSRIAAPICSQHSITAPSGERRPGSLRRGLPDPRNQNTLNSYSEALRRCTTSTEAKVIGVLERIAQTNEVRENPDLHLFEVGLLDSLALVELIVGLEEEFGIEISPAEIERDQWATPRMISSYIEALVGA